MFDYSTVELRSEKGIVLARQKARQLALTLGFGSADQTKLATAVSELARNVIRYAGEGVVRFRDDSDAQRRRLEVTVEDHGPGIGDVQLAMQDGFSTSVGLGAGLPGTKRLVDEFELFSVPGHTLVRVAMNKPKR